ncbi:jg26468 [Pararge aegeria aegeria]|uniref:Jg26468 protein n=1 Tax=Pararge aegeria aegeria TaxID=348720 RepID=A0A8S4QKY8_9NEOP|nr:jg26468 [Pararge aegeria aegeria]
MLVVLALAVVGAVVVAGFVIDSLWSVVELITSYLMPYFIPAEVLPLAKRFGPWAGPHEVIGSGVHFIDAEKHCIP